MRELTRLIDANANRATEAARTLEDIARFVLDDGPLAAIAKRMRHSLEDALGSAGFARSQRTRDRDVALDAGIANSMADDHTRSGLADIVAAASSRLTEALRVLEEGVKTVHPAGAASLEALRYTAYDAERRLQRSLILERPRWAVCVLITEALCVHYSWQDIARGAIDGGASCLQLREKDLGDRELLGRASFLVRIARDQGVAVVINDRPDLALLAGADGVHLGQDDLRVSEARRIAGDRMLVGVSCSSVEQAIAAAEADADIIGLGAMHPSSTKPKPSIAGPDLLMSVLGHPDLSGLPHLAIGGIDAPRAAELAQMGCTGVAVSGAVCGAEDPAQATAEIRRAMQSPLHAEGAAV